MNNAAEQAATAAACDVLARLLAIKAHSGCGLEGEARPG